MKNLKHLALFICSVIAAAVGLTGCTQVTTTSDMCAYTQGNGVRDAKIGAVYYPGQGATKDSYTDVYYFPCNQRNIRLMPGTTDVDAQNHPVGPITWRANDKIEIVMSVRMDWTLNQDTDTLMKVFIPLCQKYACASSDATVRNANFSTPGWSTGLLGENATPAFQRAVRDVIAAHKSDDLMNPETQNSTLNDEISAKFMQYMRGTTGSTKDLMCSSGETSGWTDITKNPGDPGNTFKCGPVRITIDSVQPTDQSVLQMQQEKTKAEMAKEINKKQLEAAKEKYGDKAGEILGQIDIVKACGERPNCTVIIGNTGLMAK